MLQEHPTLERQAGSRAADRRWRGLPAVPRITLVGIILLAGLFAVLWFWVPIYLRDYLNKRGQEFPDYICHVGSVQLDLITCGIQLHDVSLVKRAGKIPVPFFKGPNVHIALQWREVIHGSFRSNITLEQPVVNFVKGPTKTESQTFLEPQWVEEVKKLVPLRINRFEVHRGDVHYFEFDASPRIDLEMDQVELALDNLTNSAKSTSEFPSTVLLTGRPFKRGKLRLDMAVNVDIKEPTFKEQLRLREIPAPALNSFLAKYAGVYAKSGDVAFYSEIVSEKGGFKGYLKPFFQDLKFEPVPKDRGGLEEIWAGIMNGLKDIFENDDKIVATQVPVSGNYKDPDLDFWTAAFGVIKNAYFEALAQGFQTPQLAPVPTKPEKG